MKILVIDDEIAALTKMKVLLVPFGECVLSTNSAQALELCENAIAQGDYFELISIDIHLKDEDGNKLLEKIMALETREQAKPAKKIMVTAMGTAENLVLAHARGCDAFLVKPVKRDALTQKMASLGFTPKGQAA